MVIPKHLPLVESGHSLKPDLKFGWKPTFKSTKAPKIPLRFNYQEFVIPKRKANDEYGQVIYNGFRPSNSLELHEYIFLKTGSKSSDILQYSPLNNATEFMRYDLA